MNIIAFSEMAYSDLALLKEVREMGRKQDDSLK